LLLAYTAKSNPANAAEPKCDRPKIQSISVYPAPGNAPEVNWLNYQIGVQNGSISVPEQEQEIDFQGIDQNEKEHGNWI
jgi:hypothetical protein